MTAGRRMTHRTRDARLDGANHDCGMSDDSDTRTHETRE